MEQGGGRADADAVPGTDSATSSAQPALPDSSSTPSALTTTATPSNGAPTTAAAGQKKKKDKPGHTATLHLRHSSPQQSLPHLHSLTSLLVALLGVDGVQWQRSTSSHPASIRCWHSTHPAYVHPYPMSNR